MERRMIINDIKANKLVSAATCIFMAVTAMLLGLSILLYASLADSIDSLMTEAKTPDFLQMHTGELDEDDVNSFSQQREDIEAMQICTFLNLQNSQISIGNESFENNMQDNGLSCQSSLFDYLVDADNKVIYGTAKAVAEEIARQTGADIAEIEPAIEYDSNRDNYNALAAYAKREHDEDMRPAIKNSIDIDNYDNIFIGYPMWWYTFPMIIYTLFDEYDFSGKTIIPFNTHMGSRDGGTYRTIRELEPGATVLEGLPVEMKAAERGCADAVSKWLGSLGF